MILKKEENFRYALENEGFECKVSQNKLRLFSCWKEANKLDFDDDIAINYGNGTGSIYFPSTKKSFVFSSISSTARNTIAISPNLPNVDISMSSSLRERGLCVNVDYDDHVSFADISKHSCLF